jgi:hypothetical protein
VRVEVREPPPPNAQPYISLEPIVEVELVLPASNRMPEESVADEAADESRESTDGQARAGQGGRP